MKALLKFTLPEEQEDFTLALNGSSYKCAQDEFLEYLRSRIKHGQMDTISSGIFEEIRAKYFEILKDHDL